MYRLNILFSKLCIFGCVHCKKVKPEYIRAAERLKNDGIGGILAAVDATINKKIAERNKVEGFPTFAYYKDGKFAWKINERTEDGFYNFMKNPVEPPPPDVSWSEHPEKTHVMHLTAENFKAELKKKRHALVIFYAPWCGYCKRVKPKFFEAAEKLSVDARIVFGAVDCTIEKSLCQEYRVQGFPTIIYLSYGKNRIDYSGEHETSAFISFVRSGGQVGKPEDSTREFGFGSEVVVLDGRSFEDVVSHGNIFVMFFSPWCAHCKVAKQAFSEAAEKCDFGKFAAVDCTVWTDLCDKHKVKGYPTFKIFVNGDEQEYVGERTASDFVTAFKKVVKSAKEEL